MSAAVEIVRDLVTAALVGLVFVVLVRIGRAAGWFRDRGE